MIRHQIYSLLLIICTSQSIRTMENAVTSDVFGVTDDKSYEANDYSKTLTLLGRRLNGLDHDLEIRLLALERNMQTTISREYIDERLRVQQERITSLMLSLDQLDKRINEIQPTLATKQEVSALQNQINTANSGISSLQAGLNNVANNLPANVTNLQNQINVINAGLKNICNLVIPDLFDSYAAISKNRNCAHEHYEYNWILIRSLKPYYTQFTKDSLSNAWGDHGKKL